MIFNPFAVTDVRGLTTFSNRQIEGPVGTNSDLAQLNNGHIKITTVSSSTLETVQSVIYLKLVLVQLTAYICEGLEPL